MTIPTTRRHPMGILQRSPVRHPSARPLGPSAQASQHLGVIAARLAAHGISNRLTSLYGIPVLTIEEPTAGAEPASITLQPDPATGYAPPLDCTCLWTPDPSTTPETTADTIITILQAIRLATTPCQATPPRH